MVYIHFIYLNLDLIYVHIHLYSKYTQFLYGRKISYAVMKLEYPYRKMQ